MCRPKLLEVVIGLFELPRDESVAGEDIPGAIPAMNGGDQQTDDSSGFILIPIYLNHAIDRLARNSSFIAVSSLRLYYKYRQYNFAITNYKFVVHNLLIRF